LTTDEREGQTCAKLQDPAGKYPLISRWSSRCLPLLPESSALLLSWAITEICVTDLVFYV